MTPPAPSPPPPPRTMSLESGEGDEPRLQLRRRDMPATLSEKFGPNMTPMVDVVLVILIFFMAATVVVGPELSFRTAVEREEASTEVLERFELPPVRLTIKVDLGEGGRARCDGLGVTNASLDQAIARLGSFVEGVELERVVVAIDPTDAAPYEAIVRLHEACARLKIRRVGTILSEVDGPPAIGVE